MLSLLIWTFDHCYLVFNQNMHVIFQFGSKISSSSNLRKRSSYTINSKGLLEKIWECVRTNNGIMVSEI